MPADTSRSSHGRKPSRKVVEDEELELKRLRGEISCAECRRLKLRCDKNVPCSSCVRRGCSTICPLGSLSSGQGTRFILADTEHLHKKIAEMSQRIRQLEDALAILQASVSSERHALLSEELLKIKFGPEAFDVSHSPINDDSVSQTLDALGTLSVGDGGEVKYFGRSAGSEALIQGWDQASIGEDDDGDQLPLEIGRLAELFPFTSKNVPNLEAAQFLFSSLPPHERALSLCQCFFDNVSWYIRVFGREELLDEIITPLYQKADKLLSTSVEEVVVDDVAHRLATLFMAFAVAALLDLTLEPYNSEAKHYYTLGRAALSLGSVYESPTIETVQALTLMAAYRSISDCSRDSVWLLLSTATRISEHLGLHRDSSRWNLDPKTVQSRRALFWELFTADMSISMSVGRPPAFHLPYVDCELPSDDGHYLDNLGQSQAGFLSWKLSFARDIAFPTIEATLAAQPPSYSTIADLDRTVRQKSFPPSFKPYANPGDDDFHSAPISIRTFYLSQLRTFTMLHLHKSFFAQAMLDRPADPLHGPFAPSVLVAYRCASVVIKATVHQYERAPKLTERLWFLLQHTFSAAIIVGSVVSRCPSSVSAPTALMDLEVAVELFQKLAISSRRARIALRILYRLRERASDAYSQFRAGRNTEQTPFTHDSIPGQEDELAVFGGQARIVSGRASKKSFTPRQTGSPSSPLWPQSPTSSADSVSQEKQSEPIINVHMSPDPSLLEYLNFAPEFELPPDQALHPDAQLLQMAWSNQLMVYDGSSASQFPASVGPAFPVDSPPASVSSTQPVTISNSTVELAELGLTSEYSLNGDWISWLHQSGILESNSKTNPN